MKIITEEMLEKGGDEKYQPIIDTAKLAIKDYPTTPI